MNRHWVTLEYPEVLRRLAAHTDFSGGRELAFQLTPVFEVREARERLALTREAKGLLEYRPDFALGGISDIRALAEQADRGVTLSPASLLEVRNTVQGAERLHRTLTRLETQFPGLADIGWRIQPMPELADAIARVLNDRGEVRDDASPALGRIRRDLRVTQDRIQDRLQRIIASPEVAPFLQEALITRRGGRFVIPVQTDFKGQVQGIIHDRSASGATLFMEPTQIVELNNTLRELKLAEEDEIANLLKALSALVAQATDRIVISLEALAELDLTLAKARYAFALQATEPEILEIAELPPKPVGDNRHPGTRLQLKEARHPLLPPDQVVPIDVVFDESVHVLVITGPNTGGKTVSLKTVGLLTLMALAGMHIPAARGSALSCFSQVVADIGDEQSIEQNLSTFSSHLTNILSFLPDVGHDALVLLDELGAGTDPAEGSALAQALLEAFRQRRCTVLVATHYPELKLYAHHTPGVQNASMEFSVETLAPTFRLIMGLPGRSNAFAIAQRLGMPGEIVKRAQSLLSGETLRAEDMLTDLHNLRIQQVEARDEARRLQQEAEAQALELRKRLSAIDKERREVIERAEREAQRELEDLREAVWVLRRRMQSVGSEAESRAVLLEVEEQAQELEFGLPEPESLLPELPAVAAPQQQAQRPIREGDLVQVADLGLKGTVITIQGDEALVQTGSLRTRVLLKDLERLIQPPPAPEPSGVRLPQRGASPGMQIDLRGQTVEEALAQLDRYLDAAAMAALPWVRVVHGKGTGTLRREVRRFIADHPLVASYEGAGDSEGGEGATVVHLIHGA